MRHGRGGVYDSPLLPAYPVDRPLSYLRSSMSDRTAHHIRSATPAGIAFTITDLEIANTLMRMALTTDDTALALRTYNHSLRTLEETHELLLRAAPTADQHAVLTDAMALLSAKLAAFRAKPL